jgi:hypothetical protein
MINVDELTIGQMKEIKSMCGVVKTKEQKELGKNLVILQRGWIFGGDLFKNGSEYTLKNAFNVRRWGTTNGLGELAEKGKLKDTILDKVSDVTFHELTVIAILKCAQDKTWL